MIVFETPVRVYNSASPRITAHLINNEPMITLAISGELMCAHLTFREIDRMIAVRDEYLRETRHRGHGIINGE